MSYLTLEGQGEAFFSWKAISNFIAVIPLGESPPNPYTECIAAIKLKMGERYIGHESRRIHKGDYTTPEIHRCDVAETFRRVAAQIKEDGESKIIVGDMK